MGRWALVAAVWLLGVWAGAGGVNGYLSLLLSVVRRARTWSQLLREEDEWGYGKRRYRDYLSKEIQIDDCAVRSSQRSKS